MRAYRQMLKIIVQQPPVLRAALLDARKEVAQRYTELVAQPRGRAVRLQTAAPPAHAFQPARMHAHVPELAAAVVVADELRTVYKHGPADAVLDRKIGEVALPRRAEPLGKAAARPVVFGVRGIRDGVQQPLKRNVVKIQRRREHHRARVQRHHGRNCQPHAEEPCPVNTLLVQKALQLCRQKFAVIAVRQVLPVAHILVP